MAECLRMGKFAEDWKKTTGIEDYFCGSYGFENKTTKQYQEFSTAYSGVPLVMKAPFKMDIQRPILTAFCRQRIECALKRIGYQKYECKGPKLLIESINQIRKNFLTNQFQ